MAISVSWYDEGHIILAEPDGTITIEDVLQFSRTVQSMLEESDAAQVHLLLDQTNLQHVPHSIHEIHALSQFYNHAKFGWLLLYGKPNPLIKFVTAVITHAAKPRRFDTREQALEFLTSVDSTGTSETPE